MNRNIALLVAICAVAVLLQEAFAFPPGGVDINAQVQGSVPYFIVPEKKQSHGLIGDVLNAVLNLVGLGNEVNRSLASMNEEAHHDTTTECPYADSTAAAAAN